jgi:exopolysaccharide biosynthesis predicted pyruvyltransferase EpsI
MAQTNVQAFVQIFASRLGMSIGNSAIKSKRSKRRSLNLLLNYFTLIVCLQGSKVRSTYITFAQKEKARLEALSLSLAEEIMVKEKEVERLRSMVICTIQNFPHQFILGIADRTESVSKAALDHKMKSREFIYPSFVSSRCR